MVEQNWISFTRFEQGDEGDPVPNIITTDRSAQAYRDHLPGIVMVGHRYPKDFLREQGMPDGDAATQSRLLEDRILTECRAVFPLTQKPECLHVGSETTNGIRLSYFAVPDVDIALPAISRILVESAGGAIEAPLAYDEAWADTYDRIQPNEYEFQTFWDQNVIDNLLEQGSDPKRVHPRQHWLTGAGPGLAAAVQDLEKMGCTQIDVQVDQVTCFTEDKLDLPTIFGRTWELMQIAERHGLNYDGWEAPALPAE